MKSSSVRLRKLFLHSGAVKGKKTNFSLSMCTLILWLCRGNMSILTHIPVWAKPVIAL